jgi:fibronectin-binding autotransporter adhesin
LTLNNGGSVLEIGAAGASLTNQSTIAGQGYISSNLNNQGTVDANVSGGTLYVQNGTTTNSGTFRAEAGATLDLTGSTLSNFSSSGLSAGTLTGGTYDVFSGTLKFNNGGFTNDIVTNAASILLDGAAGKPNLLDQSGNNALANFATNAASGSFTIQNGVSVTTSSSGFSNAGTVNIGTNSRLTVGGANDYVQSGGTTTLLTGTSSLALASGHAFDLNGGTLQGIGTLMGNLVNGGGTVLPGSAGSIGTLTVTGNYSDPFGGNLDINISGVGSSILDVGGTANLTGTTLDVSLLDGFIPVNGAVYEIMETGGVIGTFTDPVIQDGDLTFTTNIVGNDVFLDVSSPLASPEPASWLLFAVGVLVLGTPATLQRIKSPARQRRCHGGIVPPFCDRRSTTRR